MIQFKENNPTDSKMEGWTDPIPWDPSSYCKGSKKYNCSSLAFKSQGEYDVDLTKFYCLTVSMQKNQLNS